MKDEQRPSGMSIQKIYDVNNQSPEGQEKWSQLMVDTLAMMEDFSDIDMSGGYMWDCVSILEVNRRAKVCQVRTAAFAVGIDTGCQTPVVRKGSVQDLMLTNRENCHVELVGFDDSKLFALESGVLEYFLGSQKVTRTVLVVDGLHEDYLDSLSGVADLIFFKDGHAVGIDNGDTMHMLKTSTGTSLPTVEATTTVGAVTGYRSVTRDFGHNSGDAKTTWGGLTMKNIYVCQRVLRGIHVQEFNPALRHRILAFRKRNGLTMEELVHLQLGHQGWTSALRYELRKIYGKGFQLPDCQCNACTALAPEAPRRRFRSIIATIPGQCFSYDVFYVNANLNLLYIVDDFTTHGWVHKLHVKSDLSLTMREFDAKVQTHLLARFGRTVVPAYRADGGGENLTFAKWCDENNRTHFFSAPGSQWGNGGAERNGGIVRNGGEKNRRHAGAGVDDSFAAIEYFNHVRNRTPREYPVLENIRTNTMGDLPEDDGRVSRGTGTAPVFGIPLNLWQNTSTKFKDLLAGFHPWGCGLDVVPTHSKRELLPVQDDQNTSRLAAFIGIPRGMKGYRIRYLDTGKEQNVSTTVCYFNDGDFPLRIDPTGAFKRAWLDQDKHERRRETWPIDSAIEVAIPDNYAIPGQDEQVEVSELAMDQEQDEQQFIPEIADTEVVSDGQIQLDLEEGLGDQEWQDTKFQVVEIIGFQKGVAYKAPSKRRSNPQKAKPFRFLCRYRETDKGSIQEAWFIFDARQGDAEHEMLDVYTDALARVEAGTLDEYSNSESNPRMIFPARDTSTENVAFVTRREGIHLPVKDRSAWKQTMAEVQVRIQQIQANATGDPQSRKQMLRMEPQHVTGFTDGEKKEIMDFTRIGLWTLVDRSTLPVGAKVLGTRWVYVLKNNGIYRSRCVVMGNRQKVGRDVFQTFSPTARFKTAKVMMSVAAQRGFKDRQVDFSVAFLNAMPENEIFVSQPEGYVEPGKETWVYRLNREMYGTKTASRAWYHTLKDSMVKLGFAVSKHDDCLFLYRHGDVEIYTVIHVDDMAIVGTSSEAIDAFLKQLGDEYEIKDMGNISTFLGIQFEKQKDGYFLHQSDYVHRLAHRFGEYVIDGFQDQTPGLATSKLTLPATLEEQTSAKHYPYPEMIGALVYLGNTRTTLLYAISQAARFMSCWGESHWVSLVHLFNYAITTADYGIAIRKQDKRDESKAVQRMIPDEKTSRHTFYDRDTVEIYADSSYLGDIDMLEASPTASHGGYVTMVHGNLIGGRSKRQSLATLSSMEAELVELINGAQEAIWLRGLLEIDFLEPVGQLPVWEDNAACIAFSHGQTSHERTKHLCNRATFMRECLQRRDFCVRKVDTTENLADVMTKYLSVDQYNALRFWAGEGRKTDLFSSDEGH